MDRAAYIDEMKTILTGGGVIDIELDDDSLGKTLDLALREIQRYITEHKLVTVPFKRCINMKQYHVSWVSKVYRATGLMATSYADERTQQEQSYYIDPVYASMWNSLYGYGNMYNNYMYNIMSYNTTMQIANTLSTDLQFKYVKDEENLYVTCNFNRPQKITIEYIPVFSSVEEVKTDYWIDMIRKMALAYAKIMIGNIRKKYSPTSALWTIDTTIGDEGNAELAELREQLRTQTQLAYGLD